MPDRYVMVLISDALEHPSGARTPSPHRCLVYARVPAEWLTTDVPDGGGTWIAGPELRPERFDALLDALYGGSAVNSDGSRYVVEAAGTRVLADGGGRPWTFDDPDSSTLRPFHFVADPAAGTFRRVSLDDL